MAIKTEETEIGGLYFQADQLPYFRAQRLFSRLLGLAGPGLATLVAFAGAGGGGAKAAVGTLAAMDMGDLVPMLSAFFERLHPDTCESVTKEILATTRVKHNDKWTPLVPVMDAVVGGDFWTGLMVQGWALGVHFGNFSGARAAIERLGLTTANSEASTTSTDGKGATS